MKCANEGRPRAHVILLYATLQKTLQIIIKLVCIYCNCMLHYKNNTTNDQRTRVHLLLQYAILQKKYYKFSLSSCIFIVTVCYVTDKSSKFSKSSCAFNVTVCYVTVFIEFVRIYCSCVIF